MKNRTRYFATSSTTVLNASLMWFGIGLVSMLGVAMIFGFIPQMQDVAATLFASRTFIILMSITAIGLMIAISFMARTAKIETLIIMYIAFAIVEGFSLSMILIRFAFANQTWKVLMLLLIPSITMLVMGAVGYCQLFDFSKISRFLMFSLIGLFISGLIMMFIPGISKLWTLYSMIAYGIFTLYVGFDFWRISKLDDILNLNGNHDKETIRRYGILFGLSLLIDFIQLVWYLARILYSR
ncbi:MAG: Bax inhibitor-1 family protein [Mycoplasmatales bacterium]|nr:Bax inhibitor-1 family protein [Mycoplasmatales bacterium]